MAEIRDIDIRNVEVRDIKNSKLDDKSTTWQFQFCPSSDGAGRSSYY